MTRKRPQAKRRHSPTKTGRRWGLKLAGALASLGLLGLLGWGGVVLSRPDTLPIRSVGVEGAFRHLTRAQLQAEVAPHASGGFFTVDVRAVQGAAEAMPWVDRVSVRRVWPDRLRLHVVEQEPLARWAAGGLINTRGERFDVPAAQAPEGLPLLDGPAGQEAVLAHWYRDVNQALASLGRSAVAVRMDPRRAWRVRLDNGLELDLGRSEAYGRLMRFVGIYPRVLEARAADVRRVDLRYTNGFAVSWRQAPGQNPAAVLGG